MPTPAGERRTVSVLMVDVADSTAIGEKLGPERSKFLFDEVVRLIAAEVERFGGTVAQLSGDGLYALFGAPTAHDDDAERAVRAGLAIHEALAPYARDVGEAYGIELRARAGVNTGPVVLLPEEAPPEERYNALGDTVNVAARLQAHAGAGGVAVGPETARHVERVFELSSLGELELKGKAEPVEAFSVAGERAEPDRARSPLVGRESEVAVLEAAFADLVEGRGAIVAVTGEAGIGKSRLTAELRARLDGSVRFLEAQSGSFAQEIPYYPLRSLLRDWLGLGLDDPEARARLELKTALATLLDERGAVAYPFLGTLLGLTLEEETAEAVRALAPDAVKLQTHRLTEEFVAALARGTPLCLVLEDLHFADEPTLELVEELLGLAESEPVLFLLLYRSDPDNRAWDLGEHARRGYRHRFTEIQLEPLDSASSAQLAESAAGAEMPLDLAQLLTERTGGNPFFLEEALADLVERGELRRVNNHVELAVSEDDLTLPAAVQETLQARLDRLSPDARELAAVTSVVGQQFGTQLLERLLPAGRIAPGLSELQRLELVVEAQRRPTLEYRFRHGLVRQAAYEGILEERRRELHGRVGRALEELDAEEVPVSPGTLAHHFAEAGDPERAARYLLEAGDAARALYADEEAIASWRRALAFLDRLGDSERARAALYKIALSHHLSFDFESANEAWAEAAARPAPPPTRVEPSERIHVFADAPVVSGSERVTPGYAYEAISWKIAAPLAFRGLFRLSTGLDVVPDLADEASVSVDGLVYRFRIRPTACWNDGRSLTADDFAFTVRAIRDDPEIAAGHLLGPIRSAEALDEHTLELRLEAPCPYLLHILASPLGAPWPRHEVEAAGGTWNEKEPLVSNGPFVVTSATTDRIVMEASPVWEGDQGSIGSIELTCEHLAGGEERWAPAIESWDRGAFDVCVSIPPESRFQGADVVEVDPIHTVFVYLNPRLSPLDDVRVRRAFAHAVRRGEIAGNVAPGHGGLIPPGLPGHVPELALYEDRSVSQALLAEAGYPAGAGLPSLRAATPSGHDTRGRALVEQLEAIGVSVDMHEIPILDLWATATRDHVFVGAWEADFPDAEGVLGPLAALIEWLAPDAETEGDIRSRLATAVATHDRDERLRLFREVDRILVREVVTIVPLGYPAPGVAVRPWIEGIVWSSGGWWNLDRAVVNRPA